MNSLAAHGAESLDVLPADADPPPRRLLRQYLLGEAQKHFDARREAIAALKTPEDVARRQSDLRAKFLAALGDLPERTPLNAVVVGRMPADGFTIEKVIYESRPNHHVTATLYLPKSDQPVPGVIMPIGHSSNGKAAGYMQFGGAIMARHGIAALVYDPIGQGERRQLLDDSGKPAISNSTSEHTLIGVGAILLGRNTASYRVWDGMRSLDYLASRPEVDPKRLGCTGCSGGGTETSYLMALDERIVAAAPSCYITSLERLFATIGPQDAEQNITGQVAFGMEHADYLLLRAPQPTILCAATRDFFDIQGTWTSFREAKRVYGIFGLSERVDLIESDSSHGYGKPHREAAMRWMRRWLLDQDDEAVEDDYAVLADAELACTPTGQVLSHLKGRSVFDLQAERADELARQRAAAPRKPAELLPEVRRLLALPEKIPAAEAKEHGTIERDGYQIVKRAFATEPGITAVGLEFVPAKPAAGPLVIYLGSAGKAAAAGTDGAVERLVKEGRRVLALDVRGVGELSPSGSAPKRGGLFGSEYNESFLSLHLARPLLGQRVYDVLSVIEAVAKSSPGGVELVGVGSGGLIALHAAALDVRVKSVTLDGTIRSWTEVVKTPLAEDQLAHAVPGALLVYDLPELAATIAPRPVAIR
jgi:cephalosporin-C deacetylase-like acetyl esterase